jgi:glycine cleavage system transcriptional repressor
MIVPDDHYALALIGVDRPGIVAAVASGLSDLGCNLEDVTTSMLRGHFAMVLEFSAPPGGSADAIRMHLLARTGPLDLHLDVWPVTPSRPEGQATHVLRLRGPDQIGIVAAMADALAGLGANIRDMSCSRDDLAVPTYVVVVEVDVPSAVADHALERELRAVADRLDLHFVLEPIREEPL